MIERNDEPDHRPLYFCWMTEPGDKHIPRGEHSWTPDWQRGAKFATREEAETHTNGDPLLRVCEHAMMQMTATSPLSEMLELLAQLEEIGGNNAGAFTLRNTGAVGEVFERKLAALAAYRASIEDEVRERFEPRFAELKKMEDDVQFYSGNEAAGYADIARLKSKIFDELRAALSGKPAQPSGSTSTPSTL
jgi:hypothetical protein